MEYQELKKILYKSFDTNGIRVKPVDNIKISFSKIEFENIKTTFESILVPYIQGIDISISDLENFIFEYIYDTVGLRINSIEDLKNNPSINGLPFILTLNDWSLENMAFCLAIRNVPGSITIKGEHKIISMGNIERINGDLGFSQSEIVDLGKLKHVEGMLWVGQTNSPFTKLKDLGELNYVGGNLTIKSSPIKSLSKLEYVGGTLNLRKTNIESLGNLKYVGEHLYLPKHLKGYFDLSKITVDGKIKYFSE
jgi:hypothetical protein